MNGGTDNVGWLPFPSQTCAAQVVLSSVGPDYRGNPTPPGGPRLMDLGALPGDLAGIQAAASTGLPGASQGLSAHPAGHAATIFIPVYPRGLRKEGASQSAHLRAAPPSRTTVTFRKRATTPRGMLMSSCNPLHPVRSLAAGLSPVALAQQCIGVVQVIVCVETVLQQVMSDEIVQASVTDITTDAAALSGASDPALIDPAGACFKLPRAPGLLSGSSGCRTHSSCVGCLFQSLRNEQTTRCLSCGEGSTCTGEPGRPPLLRHPSTCPLAAPSPPGSYSLY
jgi:hypothetical protein